jgi:hypothetical protein
LSGSFFKIAHIDLCAFQSSFWQTLPQYCSLPHPEHELFAAIGQSSRFNRVARCLPHTLDKESQENCNNQDHKENKLEETGAEKVPAAQVVQLSELSAEKLLAGHVEH